MKGEIYKAILGCLSGLIIVAAGWFVGQGLTYGWAVRQKRREMQLVGLQQFYVAYGEFFAVWKLWNRLDKTSTQYEDRTWELIKRAAAAEAIVEGLLVKLSSEAVLNEHQICVAACFRQGFQQLRQAIQQERILGWMYSNQPEYKAFKSLTVQFAQIISVDWATSKVEPHVAANQLMEITHNRWESIWTARESSALASRL